VRRQMSVDAFLVRHGESHATVDPLLYTSTANHTVELSKKGEQQAAEAGAQIRQYYE